jgi:hypothetical protein
MPALRFRPPPLAIPVEVRWMLLRAFGPAGTPFPGPVDPAGVLAMARRFEVSARIAARQGRERLTAELGAEAAEAFVRDRRSAAAVGLRLQAAARRVAEVAARTGPVGLPLAFLKFMALETTGVLAAGSRDACDVDVLAPEDWAEDLWRALLAAGWHGSGLPDAEHQLPALKDPEGGVVEVHRLLPGVRLAGFAGGSSATFEALDRQGLLVPLPLDWPGRSVAPAPEVQAAHVLVHGLGQHGYWPASYSLLRMVADLIDLGALSGRAARWVEKDVSPAEAEAVRRLCACLAAGENPQGIEETLLRHMLAGRLDPDYEKSLRLGLFQSQPSDRSRPAQLAHAVLGAVFLTDAQIDALYGRPRTRLGYLGRRLARPFDLLLRLGRYGLQWVLLRVRVRGYTPPP